jgi:uncharacterized membrane protein YagU involved in acid resistance
MSSNIPREIYIVGIIAFYLVLSGLYVAIGNTLTEVNNEDLPKMESRDYDNPLANNDQRGLFSYIIKGFEGYNDSNLAWINWIFILLLPLVITMIVMLLVHG